MLHVLQAILVHALEQDVVKFQPSASEKQELCVSGWQDRIVVFVSLAKTKSYFCLWGDTDRKKNCTLYKQSCFMLIQTCSRCSAFHIANISAMVHCIRHVRIVVLRTGIHEAEQSGRTPAICIGIRARARRVVLMNLFKMPLHDSVRYARTSIIAASRQWFAGHGGILDRTVGM